LILGVELLKINKEKITQNHICLLVGTLNCMRSMIMILSNNISELNEEDMYTPIFQNTLNSIEKITDKARDQMINISISL